MTRDGFSQKTIEIVAKRSGYHCSNPGCRRGTVGPSESDSQKHDLIGVAAHISAASVGGPRYNPNLTAEERASIENAIHLCENCAKLIDCNQGTDFSIEVLLWWKETHETEVREGLKNPKIRHRDEKAVKSSLEVLEYWSKLLDDGVYKSRFDVVEFFCRWVIPFIQKHSDLQPLVANWRKEYEGQILKNSTLQQKVLQETTEAFQKIVQFLVDPEERIKLEINDIEEILSGRPSREGYSSWPQYRKAYHAVKKLLEMLLEDHKIDFSNYGILKTAPRYVEKDGKYQMIDETYIEEFTFAPTIDEAVAEESAFTDLHFLDPVKAWSYFEAALYFWSMSSCDIKESLEYLNKLNPLRAASQQVAWLEINQVKSRREGNRTIQIFTIELFREGLRTIMNEVILASV